MKKQNNPKDQIILDLVLAGLSGDAHNVELVAVTLARHLKASEPIMAQSINSIVSNYSLAGSSFLRSAGGSPIPTDSETQLEMGSITSPNDKNSEMPILSIELQRRLSDFIEERKNIEVLLQRGLKPSCSLLLIGPPGTGKTMVAKYLASALNKNLVTLDLSSSMSSLMGKTSSNIKRIIQYAKKNACVLLFDEFDAIAKKRDDNTDLGEIKRVVNMLLMELEEWPVSSVLIATSNHPELLDRAVWRRFDHTITLDVPEQMEREQLLQIESNSDIAQEESAKRLMPAIAMMLEGKSASDIRKFMNNVKRRVIIRREPVDLSLINELSFLITGKHARGQFCVVAKRMLGNKISVRDLAKLTGLSTTGVQHHLQKHNETKPA